MPHLRFENMSVTEVKELSKKLSPLLSEEIGCPVDWFTFALASEVLFCDGKEIEDTVIAHVNWFDRGEPVKGNVAKLIMEEVNKLKKVSDVTTIFYSIEKPNYFENGVNY